MRAGLEAQVEKFTTEAMEGLRELEAELAGKNAELARLRGEAEQLTTSLTDAQTAGEAKEQEAAALRVQVATLEDQIAALERKVEGLEEQVTATKEIAKTVSAAAAEGEQGTKEVIATLNTSLADAETRHEATVVELTAANEGLERELSALRGQFAQLEADAANAAQEHAAVRAGLEAQVEGFTKEAMDGLQEMEATQEKSQAELARQAEQLQAAEGQLAEVNPETSSEAARLTD